MPPGQLLTNLVVKVFEARRQFSIDNFSMPFNPIHLMLALPVPPGDKTWGFLQVRQSHRLIC
jgi:hypothetical protein